jgi:glycogen debranching enzyme
MVVDMGREVGGNLALAESREWLCTNGIGGFASGTVAGLLTRRYHGLLVAALQPPLGRRMLVAKLDEAVDYDGIGHLLATNCWADGTIVAVPLPESPLSSERQRQVVDTCARHLLTSFGLRSLAPSHPRYQGRYAGGPRERDAGYHQGPVWGWFLGPFARAHFRVYNDAEAARGFLQPFAHHRADYGLGSIAEIFDGDPPFAPRGCIAQAWSVSETLRAWLDIANGSPSRTAARRQGRAAAQPVREKVGSARA